MKKNLLSLLSMACAVCLFTACENDDDAPFTVPSQPVTYKSGEGLFLLLPVKLLIMPRLHLYLMLLTIISEKSLWH